MNIGKSTIMNFFRCGKIILIYEDLDALPNLKILAGFALPYNYYPNNAHYISEVVNKNYSPRANFIKV